jgi:superfamily II DNA helicase RecQ
MRCQSFTLRLGAHQVEDLARFNAFLGQVVPLQVSSALIPGNPPMWSVLVFYDETLVESGRAVQPLTVQKADPAPTPVMLQEATSPRVRLQLSEADKAIYDALRVWRAERAKQNNLPPYVIAHNQALEKVAQARPASLEELGQIEGFGKRKVEQFGQEILRIVARG